MLHQYERQRFNNPQNKDVSHFIKHIKQSLLKQAYDNSLNSKKFVSPHSEKSEQQTIKKTASTLNIRKSTDHIQNQSDQSRVQSKYKQGNIFNHLPNQRSQQKKHLDRIKLMEQNDIINTLQRHQSLQIQKIKKKRDQYKMQLQYQMSKRKQEKDKLKQNQIELQKSKLHRNNSLNNKNNSFIQYYRNAEAYQQNNAQHYIKYFTNIKLKQQEKKRKQKDQNEKKMIAMKVQMLQQARQKQMKKQQLKKTLQWQIYEKKNQDQNEINKHKNSGYIKFQNNQYNPIYNPIDYKSDMNNKYIMNQIVRNSSPKSIIG